MATNNTNRTHTPGTVKGTARVTTTELRPGMTIRFPGRKSQGRAARLATIASVTSELRANPYGGKRARWYVTSFTDGRTSDFAPATRHDVIAGPNGAPVITDEGKTVISEPTTGAQTAQAVTDLAAKVERAALQLILVSEPGRPSAHPGFGAGSPVLTGPARAPELRLRGPFRVPGNNPLTAVMIHGIDVRMATNNSTTAPATIWDAETGDRIGPATPAQAAASSSAGDDGVILIDPDGDVVQPGT